MGRRLQSSFIGYATIALIIVSLLASLCAAERTKAIIPLYVDIDRDPKAWEPLYKSIGAHPRVEFTIIVNPDDGPGKNALPSNEWSKAVEKLKSFQNVELLGYVKIGYAKRSISTVINQINKYAGWTSKKSSIAVDGIFLDEAPYVWNETIGTYLGDVRKAIKSSSGLGRKSITINPGVPPDNQYFNIADVVCVVENKYAFWTTDQCKQLLATINAPRDRRCIILHSVPNLGGAGYSDLVMDVRSKAGSIFITDIDKDYYGKWGKNYPLNAFVGDVDK